MSDEDFRKLLAEVAGLTPVQLATLDASVRGRLDAPPTAPGPAPDGRKIEAETDRGIGSVAELDAQFAASPSCPHCQSTTVGKWGTASGLRRYRCKSCEATFNALTGTPLAQLHKKELWIGARPSPRRRHQFAQGGRPSRHRSDDRVPLAASLSQSPESPETHGSQRHC